MSHRTVRVVCTVAALVLLAGALVVALLPLPAPAAGGTCGPGAGSESPAAAFFDPGSIGAGPRPTAASGQRPQWNAFVTECQGATDRRMGIAGGLVLLAVLIGLAVPPVVRRVVPAPPADSHADADAGATVGAGMPPPGWYADPQQPGAMRWWDGAAWGVQQGPAPWVRTPSAGSEPPLQPHGP